MKGKLILAPNDEMELFDYNLNLGVHPFDYEISINTDLSDNFVSLISTTGDLEESIETSIELTDNQSCIDFYSKCKSNLPELLKNAEYVVFGFEMDEIAKYIKDNPILKTKKILFTDIYDLDPEIIDNIESAFGSETSNIYFDVAGNSNFISFQEYKDTIKAIDNMVQEIERFNFSPLEKIMYAYDLVRNKVYTEVSGDEDKLNSRTLSSVLLGDKIVCVGYARIFKTLLEKLGIHSREVHLNYPDRIGGHARNEIYIKDEKYGVDGVYYFDPTWDSKKDENDISYLSSYRFFAMTKSAMDSLDNGRFIDDKFPYFSSDIMWEFEEAVEEKGFEKLPPQIVKSINHMSGLVYDKALINKVGLLPMAPESLRPDKDKIIDELIPLVEYFDTPLSADLMLKVLYNVRKNQYYSNPQKYHMSLNDFFQIVVKSGWVFDDDTFTRSILSELSSEQRVKIKAHQLKKYSDENDLEKNIEQVKLAKVLRLSYEKRTQSK